MYSFLSLKRRVVSVMLVVVFLCLVCIGRLHFVQVISSKDLQGKASSQWLRDLPLTAKRGNITDRNGVVLASSYTVYDIYVRPALSTDSKSEAKAYSSILSIAEDEVYKKLTDRSVSESLLKMGASKEELTSLISSGYNSFVATENYERSYMYGPLLSQILGFTTIDGVGQSGIELEYDKILKGINGLSLVDGDAKGKELEGSESYYIPPIEGLNVELTINFKIQEAVETILKRAIGENGSKSGSALVMDPRSGEIIAVSTLPSLDLSDIDRTDTEGLFNLSRSFIIQDTYEPGSTFKTLVAAMALDMGVVSVDSGFYCPGYMIIDGVRANCHKKTGHGSQTLMSGFCNSCNCVFMQVVSKIGVDKFYEYLNKFHISSKTGVDFPSEAESLIIDKNNLSRNDFYRNGFGHSIALSGLQLMTSISSTVTSGNLMQPYLVKSVYDKDGNKVYSKTPSVLENAVNPSIIPAMQALMKNVVDKGGGKASSQENATVGGKTGTAQKYDNGVVSTGNYIGSYICYSPIENPRYAVLVLFDEPKSSIYGNIVATPVAGEILKEIYKIEGFVGEGAETYNKVTMPDVRGLSLTEAGALLYGLGFYYVTEGEGDYVTYQSIEAGTEVVQGSSVMIKF